MESLYILKINITEISLKDNMITANKIIKSYNGKRILDEVSLELKRGEITVLFGPSGCGKTTLCRNLTLLENPNFGNINIDNTSYTFPSNNNYSIKPYPKVNGKKMKI